VKRSGPKTHSGPAQPATHSGPARHAGLATQAPFHLEATVRVLQRRPANPVDVWERGRYLRVLPAAEGLALLAVADRGTVDAPELRLEVRGARLSGPARADAKRTLRTMLGLDADPTVLQRPIERVPRLRAAARALRGMRPPRFADLFETFANVVPFQQVSLEAGIAIVGRLVAAFGRSLELDGRRYFAFPAAAAVADAPVERLRACGLSGRKAETLRNLARLVASGRIDQTALERMPTAEARETLVALPGIGPWSASLVLLRGLGRLDLFPPGDVGANRTLRTLLGLGELGDVEREVERFGDTRGYVYFYALASSLLERGLIAPAPG
jgi:DNA-3-methyladenine glycosylase II